MKHTDRQTHFRNKKNDRVPRPRLNSVVDPPHAGAKHQQPPGISDAKLTPDVTSTRSHYIPCCSCGSFWSSNEWKMWCSRDTRGTQRTTVLRIKLRAIICNTSYSASSSNYSVWTKELQINNPLIDGWTTSTHRTATYKGADKSLARPGRKQDNVSVRITWISFSALSCRKRNLMTARVSILLKSRSSLTCFRACFLLGRAKDLSAPQ